MNRLAHLQQTLGAMSGQPGCSCVVVDYSCPQHAGDWVEAHGPPARVVRCPGRNTFSRAAANNAGARAADAPWIAFVDADVLLAPDFARTLLPTLRPGWSYRPEDEALSGILVCARDDFERAGGFDETFEGWGDEDHDLSDALEFAGVRQARFPNALVRHLSHGSELRSRFHAVGDLDLSFAINRVYRFLKWDLARLTGAVPAPELRRQLYGAVAQRVKSVWTGTDEVLEVGFAFYTIPGKWRVDRCLNYQITPGRGPLESRL
jgi:hypothetical protein